MSTITERVDAILKKRKEKVPEVQKRLDALRGIREEVVNFENLKKEGMLADD